MQREPISSQHKKLILYDVKTHTQSWAPAVRNNWVIKFSVYKCNVLLMFTSAFTSQTIIRYFADEDSACRFINFILSKDPAEELVL